MTEKDFENPYGCDKHALRNCQIEYSYGYDAGFRGDQLIAEHPVCYIQGYEAGKTAKMLETGDFGAAKAA